MADGSPDDNEGRRLAPTTRRTVLKYLGAASVLGGTAYGQTGGAGEGAGHLGGFPMSLTAGRTVDEFWTGPRSAFSPGDLQDNLPVWVDDGEIGVIEDGAVQRLPIGKTGAPIPSLVTEQLNTDVRFAENFAGASDDVKVANAIADGAPDVKVVLPASMDLDAPVEIDDDGVHLVGQGITESSISLSDSFSGDAAFIVGRSSVVQNVTIAGMRLNGNKANLAGNIDGILIEQCTNFYPLYNYIRDFPRNALRIVPQDQEVKDVQGYNTILEACEGAGAYVEALGSTAGADIRADRVWLSDFYSFGNDIGIHINGSEVKDWQIRNALTKNNAKEGVIIEGSPNGSYIGGEISRNNTDSAGHSNIKFDTDADGFRPTNIYFNTKYRDSRSQLAAAVVEVVNADYTILDGHVNQGSTTMKTGGGSDKIVLPGRWASQAADPSSGGDWNHSTRAEFARLNNITVWDTSTTPDTPYKVGPDGNWHQLPNGSQDFTLSNVTTDRNLDANSTTTAELADVLATLIQDLGMT